ncbi:MAG: hypothetical protein IIV05_00680 [Ruminococcus sp.]|nr:hypothetical protein [Ruminococcus sp.]
MNEWGVLTALAAIVGLFLSVGKPIINLNTSITILNESLKAEKARREQFEKDSCKEHDELWAHEATQDQILAEHKMRLHDLDGK